MAGKGVQNGIVILTGRRADSPWCSTKTLLGGGVPIATPRVVPPLQANCRLHLL